LIKYIKSFLWRVAKRLSYTADAGYLKVNRLVVISETVFTVQYELNEFWNIYQINLNL